MSTAEDGEGGTRKVGMLVERPPVEADVIRSPPAAPEFPTLSRFPRDTLLEIGVELLSSGSRSTPFLEGSSSVSKFCVVLSVVWDFFFF